MATAKSWNGTAFSILPSKYSVGASISSLMNARTSAWFGDGSEYSLNARSIPMRGTSSIAAATDS